MSKIYVLVLLLVIFAGLYGLSSHGKDTYLSEINSHFFNGSNQCQASTEKINPDNPNIKEYFHKVVKVPYKADYNSSIPKKPVQFWKDNYGDCDDKSAAFADYLNRIGAEDVKIVIIVHNSREYSHCVVMWKNHIFDPSLVPPIYNMEKTKYFSSLKKNGFNLQVTYPYTYYKKCYFNT